MPFHPGVYGRARCAPVAQPLDAQVGNQQGAIGGLRAAPNELLPGSIQACKLAAKRHILAELTVALRGWPLKNRHLRIDKGPVVGDPAVSQHAQRDGGRLLHAGEVRKSEHHVVDRAQQRNLIAGDFAIVNYSLGISTFTV